MYEVLANYYDLFMGDVPYDKWADYVCRLLGSAKGQGVDFGCGTGRFTTLLHSRGYSVLGVDVSTEMLAAAAERARKAALPVSFVQGDIRSFRPMRLLQFATAMCDTLNYVAQPQRAFRNVYNCLDDKGIFVFDISSAYKLCTILAGQTYSETCDDITYIWQSSLSGRRLTMDLTFFAPTADGMYRKRTETQVQYVHRADELQAMLAAVGFRRIHVYGGMTRRPPVETDKRIHFVAQK